MFNKWWLDIVSEHLPPWARYYVRCQRAHNGSLILMPNVLDYLKIKQGQIWLRSCSCSCTCSHPSLIPTARLDSSACCWSKSSISLKWWRVTSHAALIWCSFCAAKDANSTFSGHKNMMVSKSRCWVSLVHLQMKSCHLEFWIEDARLKNIWICSSGFEFYLREARKKYTVANMCMGNCILKYFTLDKSPRLGKWMECSTWVFLNTEPCKRRVFLQNRN